MKYPELLLLPMFMFLDYFLTVACSRLGERGFHNYFATEHYELNPVWQRAVASKRWFNWKHTLLTVVVSSALISLVELVDLPQNCVEGGIGFILVLFAAVLARHISNLLVFQYVARHPDQVSGRVVMSHLYVLWVSCFQCVTFLIPLVVVAIFSRNAFAVGGAFGAFVYLTCHVQWTERYKTARRRQEAQATVPNEQNDGRAEGGKWTGAFFSPDGPKNVPVAGCCQSEQKGTFL
jgi:hypothetical protein